MSTTVCPKCGAKLDASARFCASCGQAVSAPAGVPGPPPTSPGPAGGKKVPVLPIAIFGGGLVVLVGALTYMRSSAPSGGGAPGSAPPVSSSAAPVAPATTAPATVAFPGAPATSATPAMPASSALSVPDTIPPAPPPDATAAGSRAPSTKSWRDPLAPGPGSPPPPRQAATRLEAPPPAPAGRPASSPAGRPAPPPGPPPVSKTYECSEYAIFNISPEDIKITVDGQSIGTADRWDGDGEGKKYLFRGPGIHYVKLSHENYETVWLKFDVSESSIYRTADVEVQMKRVHRKGD